MLKVFLVEDEFVVREGIKKNIDWAGHGYDFCGEAQDGELAFPMIQKLKPDIVITDIKMPFMDGLELSRMIKKDMPSTEIIILSGFQDFEYAKEGIKIGVAQYLTKPIKGDDLLKEVDLIAKKIEEKQVEESVLLKYQEEMEENNLRDKKALFDNLVSGGHGMQKLMEEAEELEMDLTAMWYSIILLKVRSMHHNQQDEYSSSQIQIAERLSEIIDSSKVLIFDRDLEGEAFILKADSEEELTLIKNSFIGNAEKLLKEYEYVTYFGGIGSNVNRLSQLPESFEKASRAYAHRYLVSENIFLSYEDIANDKIIRDDDFDITNVNVSQFDKRKILEFLRSGSPEEVPFFVDEFIKGLGNGALNSLMFRQYIAMDVYFSVLGFLQALEYEKDLVSAPDIRSDDQDAVSGIKKYIEETVKKALELRDTKATSTHAELINDAIKYIEDNYADDELSLNSLASYVNLSPNHLSMIFSQQTGQSFIKYLTDYRMNKAKEFLKCTGKRSSEIGLEVGYKDPHYFSYIFKKTQGMTPTQFRDS
ncbi:MAG: response regulator [Lachnospiraceae bacterium]|nr:response regulator [Lachnospiraceae bacterium]